MIIEYRWKQCGKMGKIVHRELFLLLPQCFQKSSAAYASKCVCMWKRFNRSRPTKIRFTFYLQNNDDSRWICLCTQSVTLTVSHICITYHVSNKYYDTIEPVLRPSCNTNSLYIATILLDPQLLVFCIIELH